MAEQGDTNVENKSSTEHECLHSKMVKSSSDPTFAFVTIGASGDLSKKKIYPTLWYLFRDKLLPATTSFFGYSRSGLTVDILKENCAPFLKVSLDDEVRYKEFWDLNHYTVGSYDNNLGFQLLNKLLSTHESQTVANRIFYLALPPNLTEVVLYNIRDSCMSDKGWTRVIVEKPFDQGAETSQFSECLPKLFKEEEIFRIDHHIGKEIVQNVMTIRFANQLFGPTWSRDCIASVLIVCKETCGPQDRANYFDKHGIIRDMIQNHLLQILSLVAMEKPATHHSEDIRDEKVKVLRAVSEVHLQDVLLGQYVGDPCGKDETKLGYLDDPSIPKDSLTPTFATVNLKINNERWDGVPFLMRCGKALNENKTEVRVQFQDIPSDIFHGEPQRNELVIRVRPKEAVYLRLMTKSPGMSFGLEETELELTYSSKYKKVLMPSVYERLFLDVFTGVQMHFVRTDELCEAWRIFDPLLKEIEQKRIRPIKYTHGSRGPSESDAFCDQYNYRTYTMTPWLQQS